jgi:carbonic anhydrase/acetyltransferase-like protein (isoleucine patch superfamily)
MPHIGTHVQLDNPAYIHPTAQLQGRVSIGVGVSIWTYAVTRSEVYEIRIGARTNIQDFVMIHEGSGFPTIVGEDCSITHHVTLHGCEIGDRCLIGIGATIMDGVKIGDNSIVAGNAIVTEGSEFPANSVIGGVPAKLLATRDNSEANLQNAAFYSSIAARYAEGHDRLKD